MTGQASKLPWCIPWSVSWDPTYFKERHLDRAALKWRSSQHLQRTSLTALLLILGLTGSFPDLLQCVRLHKNLPTSHKSIRCSATRLSLQSGLSAMSSTRKRTAIPLGLNWQISVGSGSRQLKQHRPQQLRFIGTFMSFFCLFVMPVASTKRACKYTTHKGESSAEGVYSSSQPVLSTAPGTALFLDK